MFVPQLSDPTRMWIHVTCVLQYVYRGCVVNKWNTWSVCVYIYNNAHPPRGPCPPPSCDMLITHMHHDGCAQTQCYALTFDHWIMQQIQWHRTMQQLIKNQLMCKIEHWKGWVFCQWERQRSWCTFPNTNTTTHKLFQFTQQSNVGHPMLNILNTYSVAFKPH